MSRDLFTSYLCPLCCMYRTTNQAEIFYKTQFTKLDATERQSHLNNVISPKTSSMFIRIICRIFLTKNFNFTTDVPIGRLIGQADRDFEYFCSASFSLDLIYL